jgi:hypothetical protein
VDYATTLYDKGSVVICAHCRQPLYVLTEHIHAGQGISSKSFRPVTERELLAMGWSAAKAADHAERIPEPRSGDNAACVACGLSYMAVEAPTAQEVIDRSYRWTLHVIPPGQVAWTQ